MMAPAWVPSTVGDIDWLPSAPADISVSLARPKSSTLA